MREPQSPSKHDEFEYTHDWFSGTIPVWNAIFDQHKPRNLLEIGSFEGRSACYIIEKCAAIIDGVATLTCVDTWQGSVEHQSGGPVASVMSEVERRFDHNTRIALSKASNRVTLRKVKQSSHDAMATMIAAGQLQSFDLIYIDGSHEAPDVLADAVLAFQLLRQGGIMIFDDYLWSMHRPGTQDVLLMPKPAIDAFMNIYQRKIQVFPGLPVGQLYAYRVMA
jgi:predicted O-methyltransferase YrrM